MYQPKCLFSMAGISKFSRKIMSFFCSCRFLHHKKLCCLIYSNWHFDFFNALQYCTYGDVQNSSNKFKNFSSDLSLFIAQIFLFFSNSRQKAENLQNKIMYTRILSHRRSDQFFNKIQAFKLSQVK